MRRWVSLGVFILNLSLGSAHLIAEVLPIARWNLVPYQEVTSSLAIGVVAFHKDGINRVEFRVNNGNLKTVKKALYNPISRTVEYWFSLNADRFSDGLQMVTARVVPIVGQARDLPPLPIFTNKNGSYLNRVIYVSSQIGNDNSAGTASLPFRTIDKAISSIQAAQNGVADGAKIYLLPGDYSFGSNLQVNTQSRWLTLEAAPGVSSDQVRITSGSSLGFNTKLIKLSKLTIKPSTGGSILNTDDPKEDHLWISGSKMVGPGRTVFGKWLPYGSATATREIQTTWTSVSITDSTIGNSMNGPDGISYLRNVIVDNIGSDAFSNTLMIVHSVAKNIDHRGTVNPYQPGDTFHPDVYQFYGVGENVILYNVKATENVRGQGLFAGNNVPVRNVAFVNCQVNNQPDADQGSENWGRAFLFSGPTEHLYVLDSSFKGAANWEGSFSAEDVIIQRGEFRNWRNEIQPGVTPLNQSGVTYRAQ